MQDLLVLSSVLYHHYATDLCQQVNGTERLDYCLVFAETADMNSAYELAKSRFLAVWFISFEALLKVPLVHLSVAA